ncbi:hypothetical protein ABID21_004138 [Pseudorhizobium tarimense]|uniref:Uncharacterized protein YfbK C-terminal domain-containing protein n=1 Tax=Pseudorhizobium tarimense TaxID=1079109 RepID=A0ABV2HBS2_9HYPH
MAAFYEVTPKGNQAVLNDPVGYHSARSAAPSASPSGKLAFINIRYKQRDAGTSKFITTPVTKANATSDFSAATQEVRFAKAVAAFGQKLRGTATPPTAFPMTAFPMTHPGHRLQCPGDRTLRIPRRLRNVGQRRPQVVFRR